MESSERGLQISQPHLKPLHFLIEQATKLFANFDYFTVPLAWVEPDGILQFPVAYAAIVERSRLALLNVIASVHPTFIVDAVTDAEHVPNLMSHHFACAVQHQVFTFFIRTYFIPVKFR